MNKSKNALIITFHDWKSNRLAGFHHLAKSLLISGYDVGFCSHKRPVIHSIFNRSDILNLKNWKRLFLGVEYIEYNHSLLNFTGLDITLPNKVSRLFGRFNLNIILQEISDFFLTLRCKKLFPNPNLIIIESGSSVFSYKWLKQIYKNKTFIYRPSDPCIGGQIDRILLHREKQLYSEANMVLLVNDESRELYRKFGFVAEESRLKILPNAIDLSSFSKDYNCPSALKNQPSITYIGGHPPDLNLICKIAAAQPHLKVLVVCPERLSKSDFRLISNYSNINYIEGLTPNEVPRYLLHSTIIMIPYKASFKSKPLGMHGKIMQAAVCKKPIVCKNIEADLSKFGLFVARDDTHFLSYVDYLLKNKIKVIDYDINIQSWDNFCKAFANILNLK